MCWTGRCDWGCVGFPPKEWYSRPDINVSSDSDDSAASGGEETDAGGGEEESLRLKLKERERKLRVESNHKLQQQCKALKLPVGGNKESLIARLVSRYKEELEGRSGGGNSEAVLTSEDVTNDPQTATEKQKRQYQRILQRNKKSDELRKLTVAQV